MSKHFSFDAEDQDDSDVVFRDVITLALLGFVSLVIIMLPHINPPKPKQDANKDISAPGNVIVEARWDDRIDADVDLWVQGPGDVPVGFSNLGGMVFNLLRDDIGFRNDASDLNYENAFSRSIPAGEYIVNLHMYYNRANAWPVKVKVLVSTIQPNGNSRISQQILVADAVLHKQGEEITVLRFKLDDKGKLVPGSMNANPKKIRTDAPGGYNFGAYK